MLVRLGVLCVALLVASPSFGIEPLTLILLRMVRDHTISAALETGVNSLREQPPKAPMVTWQALPALPTGTEEAELKALIDDSFVYLTAHQRAAVYDALMRIISDPQHAAIKPRIIAEFRIKATSVRETYQMLDRLSRSEKVALVSQAGDEYRKLSGDQQQELLAAVRSGMLPIPADLNELIIARFSSAQSVRN